MISWAIQRADEQWLAMDYGWTLRQDGMLRFKASCEAEEQTVRLLTSGVPCHTVAVPDEPRKEPSDARDHHG